MSDTVFRVDDRIKVNEECGYGERTAIERAKLLYVGKVNSRGGIITIVSPEPIGWGIGTRIGYSNMVKPDWYGWNVSNNDGRFILADMKGVCNNCISTCKVENKEECGFHEKK